jgi:ATP-dependent Lhr-like helicase
LAGDLRWAAIEDVGRVREGLGVPVPPGLPDAFTEAVDDPLADLVGRYARTHGPFTVGDVSARLGLGAAVVRHTLQRLTAQGRVLEGEFRPAGSGAEWCDAEVLRLLRRRSLARLRQEVEPVEPAAMGRFLLAWQHVDRARRGPRGLDGLLTVVDQLAGYAAPASAWESLILPSRVADYEPALLDELTASGEVTWVGHSTLPGSDGWVSLHLGDQAPLTLPLPDAAAGQGDADHRWGDLHRAVLDALEPGGAWFFRQLQSATGGKDRELADALWDLVWGGRITNDTFAPLRALTGSGSGTHRTRRTPGRARPTRAGVRPAPPTTTGRWALLPPVDTDPTRRAHAVAERMLERHGVVTRGAVMSERTTGGFAAVYKVLSAFEDSGRCRRGYFVEGLGAAQFGTAGAVDRLRTFSDRDHDAKPDAVTLAATDPANPYGAALPWPERETSGGHRPGRKAGALVVLVDGALTLYVERGGRTLLTWSDDAAVLRPAALALSEAGRRGALGRMTVEKADGEQILGGGSTPLREALDAAGFISTPRGLRLRG